MSCISPARDAKESMETSLEPSSLLSLYTAAIAGETHYLHCMHWYSSYLFNISFTAVMKFVNLEHGSWLPRKQTRVACG